MEENINVVEILKDKPQGTKLYDLLRNIDVELCKVHITVAGDYIECISTNEVGSTLMFDYSKLGTEKGYPNGLQILLPSKKMCDWRKFDWKKGDVLVSKDNVYIIFEKFENDSYTTFKGKHYFWKELDEEDYSKEEAQRLTSLYEKANNDDAQTYIKTIEEKLGGKLNLETLEIEKQLEFKDGDIVVTDAVPSLCYSKCILILKGDFNTNENSANSYIFYNINNNRISFDVLDTAIRCRNIRLATEEEKKQLFSALEKKGKAWDAEKKLIVDLKPKCEFKPFDRCIWKIRNCEGSIWQASFVSYVDEYGATPMGMPIDEDLVNLIILPYNDQTKLLVGTTDEWKGGEG